MFSRETFDEFRTVLEYPKFRLTESEIKSIIEEEVLPFVEIVEIAGEKMHECAKIPMTTSSLHAPCPRRLISSSAGIRTSVMLPHTGRSRSYGLRICCACWIKQYPPLFACLDNNDEQLYNIAITFNIL